MNLVKQIVDQLSGDTLRKLGSLLGMDSETAGYAASAAVPSLLASLAGMASREEGARKLTGTLGSMETGGFNDFAQLLDGDASGLVQQGASLLGSLFGDNRLTGLIGAIGNYAGLSGNATKSLLAYLLPLVLGKVAQQWKNKGGTLQALTSLFADEREHIAEAVPAGFSLSDIPGMDDMARAAAGSSRRTAEPAKRSSASWIMPLALLLVGGFLLWQFLQARPNAQQAADRNATESEPTTVMKPVVPDAIDVPDIAHMRDDLTGVFRSLDTTISEIKDAASAESAMPQLEELSRKIDGIGGTLRSLPEAGRNTLQQFVAEHLGELKAKVMDTLAIPGLSDRIRALINEIVRKLEDLHRAPPTG
jgi:hypothetical protein